MYFYLLLEQRYASSITPTPPVRHQHRLILTSLAAPQLSEWNDSIAASNLLCISLNALWQDKKKWHHAVDINSYSFVYSNSWEVHHLGIGWMSSIQKYYKMMVCHAWRHRETKPRIRISLVTARMPRILQLKFTAPTRHCLRRLTHSVSRAHPPRIHLIIRRPHLAPAPASIRRVSHPSPSVRNQ